MGKITYTVYPSLQLVHFQGVGDVSCEMIMENTLQLHSHPEWKSHFNTFIDFESAIVNAMTGGLEKYKRLFNTLQDNVPIRKWAIFTLQSITQMNANMSHILNSRSIIVDVFQRKEDALGFLNILPGQFEELVALE